MSSECSDGHQMLPAALSADVSVAVNSSVRGHALYYKPWVFERVFFCFTLIYIVRVKSVSKQTMKGSESGEENMI